MTANLAHEIAPILIAVTSLLTALSGGIWKVWASVSGRLKELEKRVDECRDEAHDKDSKIHDLATCVKLLMQEVHLINPGSSILAAVTQLLNQSFPIENCIPDDMTDLLNRLDRKGGRK